MVTSAQLRAARSLLNWTVRDLAEKADVHRNTITRAETEATGQGHAVAQIVRTLESAGVIFVEENGEGPGVRLRKQIPEPPFTIMEFQARVSDFERSRLAELRRELLPAGLAARLVIRRREDGVDLFVANDGPIGRLTLGADGLAFVPELIEGRDCTSSKWLTPNELARWIRQAWEAHVHI